MPLRAEVRLLPVNPDTAGVLAIIEGRRYYQKLKSRGKTHREALRAL